MDDSAATYDLDRCAAGAMVDLSIETEFLQHNERHATENSAVQKTMSSMRHPNVGRTHHITQYRKKEKSGKASV